MMITKSKLAAAGAGLIVFGCAAAQQPVFYPNQKLKNTGVAQAQADARNCEAMAQEYGQNENRYRDMAKSGLIGGAVGAGTGALAGTIMKDNVGRATGAGAAVGGVLGVLDSLRRRGEASPSERQFVQHCLERQGYEVSGWQ